MPSTPNNKIVELAGRPHGYCAHWLFKVETYTASAQVWPGGMGRSSVRVHVRALEGRSQSEPTQLQSRTVCALWLKHQLVVQSTDWVLWGAHSGLATLVGCPHLTQPHSAHRRPVSAGLT